MSTSAEEVIARALLGAWVERGIASEEGQARVVLDELVTADFQLVPPDEGWRVVKLESAATASMTGNFGGSTVVPVVTTTCWRITEELR